MFWYKNLIEILLLTVIFYYVIRSLQGTQGEGIIVGYVFLFILIFSGLLVAARHFSFHIIEHLIANFVEIYLFAIVVIFQQEIRNGLTRLSQVFFGKLLEKEEHSEKDISGAVTLLARSKIGALIAIEQTVGLKDYLEKGIRLDAKLSRELLCSIFWPGNPLHDGGVIIRGGEITAGSCIFPLSQQNLRSFLGTRHRAALGLSEMTDALVIIVSEERGEISLCYKGKLEHNISVKKLEHMLKDALIANENKLHEPILPNLAKRTES